MRNSIIILLSVFCFGFTGNIYTDTIDHAKQYVNVVHETNNTNRGPEIDTWLKYCGVPLGSPYCAAFSVYMFHLSAKDYGIKDVYPKIAKCSLMAKWANNNPLTVKLLTAKAVMMGAQTVRPGYMAIWKEGTYPKTENFNWNGHAGIVTKVISTVDLETIEGNTMPSSTGDQAGRNVGAKGPEGGVYHKTRYLTSTFRPYYFIAINKEEY